MKIIVRMVNPFVQIVCEIRTVSLRFNGTAAANSTFAIGGVSCSADSFVVKESAVLRMNICAEKPAHHKSANR
jgi:hypothetical protein